MKVMKLEIFKEANKIWHEYSKDATDDKFILPLKIQKKLLKLFHVGDFYYYIFNLKTSCFEFVSPEITAVLGYEVSELDIPFFLDRIHPEDQPYFLNFENNITEFFSALPPEEQVNYKVSYDYRVQKKDGSYIRLLQQLFIIQLDVNKRVLKTFGIHTDISHLKKNGIPVLSFIGLNGAPSYMDVTVKNLFAPAGINFSRREREILTLLITGKNSDQISKELYISKLTVNTHRRNLLKKTNCANTAALISMVIEKGWI